MSPKWVAEHAPIPTDRKCWRLYDTELKEPVFYGNEEQAKLFASSPDMLEALKLAQTIIEGEGLDATEIKSAIAKATGKE